jgi:hypothetical protein
MEIIYIIIMQIFTAFLIVGLIIYSTLTMKKMLIKIEHEIKNQKATQSMLDQLLKKELPQKND